MAMAMPVLPGKEEEVKQFAQEATGPKRAELEELGRQLGLHHEAWFLQQGPEGTQLVGFVEAEDVSRLFSDMHGDESPTVTWFRQRLEGITGVDFKSMGAFPSEKLVEMRF